MSISTDAAGAFMLGRPWARGNTMVTEEDGLWCLRLHGSTIAMRVEGDLDFNISTSGHPTRTTIARLNELPGVRIYKWRGILHLNDLPWDGGIARVQDPDFIPTITMNETIEEAA